MIRIAICDDELNERQQLETYIQAYSASLQYEMFSSAQNLWDASTNSFYDIIFMDIEMEAPNGYEIASRLMQQEEQPLIIFVTKSGDYTIRGYGVAFRYLPKPITYNDFCQVLALALRRAVPQKISLPIDGSTKVFSLNDVPYFEVYGHVLKIHTQDSIFTCRMSISVVAKQLEGTDFAQPHKSYLVNLGYVDFITGREITMLNGDMIPISALRKDDFLHRFKQYIRER